MKNAKICCRDGEAKATLEFCGVRVEMGLTELRNLLTCAGMDIRDSSSQVRRALEKPVEVLQTLINCLMCVQPKSRPEDDATNLKRFHETGLGGVTGMSEIEALIAEMRAKFDAERK